MHIKEQLKDSQGFQSYEEVRRWLLAKEGIKASDKVMHEVVRYKLKAKLKAPRPRSVKQTPGVEEDFKKKEICELLSARRAEIESGKVVVFMVDECHLLWGDIIGDVWGKTSERVSIPVVNARYKQTYFGGLDYKTKEFITYPTKKGDSKNTINFLKYLRSQRPGANISKVSLSCLEDDALGESLEVLWEREIDAKIVGATSWESIANRGFDNPRLFSAYLHTLRWNH